jgi:hypothetical protein
VKVKKRKVPVFKVGATFNEAVAFGKVSARKAAAEKTLLARPRRARLTSTTIGERASLEPHHG